MNDQHRTRAMFEQPPVGFTGSLKGTSWDADAILDEYRQ